MPVSGYPIYTKVNDVWRVVKTIGTKVDNVDRNSTKEFAMKINNNWRLNLMPMDDSKNALFIDRNMMNTHWSTGNGNPTWDNNFLYRNIGIYDTELLPGYTWSGFSIYLNPQYLADKQNGDILFGGTTIPLANSTEWGIVHQLYPANLPYRAGSLTPHHQPIPVQLRFIGKPLTTICNLQFLIVERRQGFILIEYTIPKNGNENVENENFWKYVQAFVLYMKRI